MLDLQEGPEIHVRHLGILLYHHYVIAVHLNVFQIILFIVQAFIQQLMFQEEIQVADLAEGLVLVNQHLGVITLLTGRL
jgi:hypothetical protein